MTSDVKISIHDLEPDEDYKQEAPSKTDPSAHGKHVKPGPNGWPMWHPYDPSVTPRRAVGARRAKP